MNNRHLVFLLFIFGNSFSISQLEAQNIQLTKIYITITNTTST